MVCKFSGSSYEKSRDLNLKPVSKLVVSQYCQRDIGQNSHSIKEYIKALIDEQLRIIKSLNETHLKLFEVDGKDCVIFELFLKRAN